MRSECYSTRCVCLCVSVKSHLTSGASVRDETAAMYSAGNEGQKKSETASFQSYGTSCIIRLPCSQPYLVSVEYARALLMWPVDRWAEFSHLRFSSFERSERCMPSSLHHDCSPA